MVRPSVFGSTRDGMRIILAYDPTWVKENLSRETGLHQFKFIFNSTCKKMRHTCIKMTRHDVNIDLFEALGFPIRKFPDYFDQWIISQLGIFYKFLIIQFL